MGTNDKKNNSKSEEKPYSDSIELFNNIFSEQKSGDAPDAKKGHSPPVTSPGKKIPKKVPQKVKRKIAPQKKPSVEKGLPPATSTVSKPIIERDVSVKKPPVTDERPVKREIEKIKLPKKPKKDLNLFLFTVMMVVLVILSIFTGKIMDYDGLMNFFKISDSLTHTSETVFYDNTNKDISVSKDLKALSQAEDSVKSKIEKSDIQGQDTTKDEENIQLSATLPLSEKTIDDISNIVKEEILSYPYSIYLGSFSNITKVKKALADYEKTGLSPYWVKIDLGEKGVWFRLFAGFFRTREEADQFIKIRNMQGAETKLTKYANLIGMYTSEEEIGKQKVTLEEQGYSPYVISDKENAFRLYVGAFYQKLRAEKQNSDLALNGIHSQVVER